MMFNRKTVLLLAGLLVMIWASPSRADTTLVELVKRTTPAVVVIEAYGTAAAQGSGFFVSETGVITNWHVIDKATSISIRTADGKVYNRVRIIRGNPTVDLAFLDVGVEGASRVTLKMAPAAPDVGEPVVVIGSPLGFEHTATTGIVSALRTMSRHGEVVQIQAPISPGSSGSPVINYLGEVVGVATFIQNRGEPGQEINFAIASGQVRALINGTDTAVIVGNEASEQPSAPSEVTGQNRDATDSLPSKDETGERRWLLLVMSVLLIGLIISGVFGYRWLRRHQLL